MGVPLTHNIRHSSFDIAPLGRGPVHPPEGIGTFGREEVSR